MVSTVDWKVGKLETEDTASGIEDTKEFWSLVLIIINTSAAVGHPSTAANHNSLMKQRRMGDQPLFVFRCTSARVCLLSGSSSALLIYSLSYSSTNMKIF